jgi:hypothetical protein
MIALDIIESKINNAVSGSPSGVCCIFVPITDKIGAKIYANECDRDGCYERQSEAADVGLGPDVYGLFELTLENTIEGYDVIHKAGNTIYGYLTEIVKTTADEPWTDELEANVIELRESLNETIGFDFYDWGPNNCGRKNGKLILGQKDGKKFG